MLEHGGTYIDASCVCLKPLDDLIDYNEERVQGYKSPFARKDPNMEIWSFTCPPSSPLISLWRSELVTAISVGFETYCETSTAEEIGKELKGRLPYLTTNLCWRKANIMRPGECVFSESNFSDGPLSILERYGWDGRRCVRDLMREDVDVGGARFLKFRGKERSYIVEMIEEGDYGERGVLTRALGLEGKEGKKGKEKKRGRVQEMRDFEGLMKSMEGGEVKPRKKKKKKKEKEGR
ncbi:hypothetical protein TrVE_jg4147 [Triparma verrucosa]|uniref:Uncharacterized protein n=1 Tax=Triparma verrucosa TaxID=1606542 RepID=A0A9W7BQE4_9STRA|nr:hypothetical protein TrVE_jg4147 [Triparma verrucosa]